MRSTRLVLNLVSSSYSFQLRSSLPVLQSRFFWNPCSVSKQLFNIFNTPIKSISSISRYSTEVKKVRRYPKHMTGELKMGKIQNEHFKSLFTPELETLHKIFQKYGYEIRMAGGPVRDLLADIKPHDLDFATTATPEEMKEMFEREGIRMINTKGEKHGTITARINDKENFEVTTLRIDVTTDGRHAEVQFTKNWALDSGRRDLTVNSMFLDFEGNIYDYFNGIEDLENKIVRFVGEPTDRIQEDYLRILRYFRFYGRIAPKPDAHDQSTLEAIRDNVAGLKQISGERIWSEIRKILSGNHAGPLMITMLELGMGPYIGFPQDPDIEEFKMLVSRLETLKLEVNPITLLTSLLRTLDHGKALHARLKFSSFERDLCLFIISHRGGIGDTNSIKHYEHLLLMLNQPPRDVLKVYIEEVLKYNGDVQLLELFQQFNPPKFPINGHMLTERQLRGKMITAVMNKLKERWINSDFQLTRDELLKMLPDVKAELSPPTPPK